MHGLYFKGYGLEHHSLTLLLSDDQENALKFYLIWLHLLIFMQVRNQLYKYIVSGSIHELD